jgi:acyl-CoA dehydrogenase
MNFEITDSQRAIVDGVAKVCAHFKDDYWSDCDRSARFPHEFYRAMADGGWLGLTMPESVGGAGMGLLEAALMMHTVTSNGGGYSAASTLHINMFGPHAIVVHGTPEQQQRWLRPLVAGEQKACFGVTEPDAGLDTTSIKTFARKVPNGYRVSGRKMWTSTGLEADKILLLTRTSAKQGGARAAEGLSIFYTDLDRTRVEVRPIHKMGRNAVDSNAVFIDDLFVPDEDLIGEEGKGFKYLLDSLNPERVLVGIEAVGLGYDALRRAADYARSRRVFGRAIGQNQGIQHPLAERWIQLEAAYWQCLRAAWLYDSGQPCGAQANAAKFLGGRAAFETATQSVLTFGGMGYASECQVERLFRESILPRIAPVTEQLILSFIAERVLDLPKSY